MLSHHSLAGADEEGFTSNDLLRSAVLQKLSVIGESAARLSDDLKKRYSYVPWADIVAFRSIIVHAYFSLRWPIVWVTATEEVPLLSTQVADILAEELS